MVMMARPLPQVGQRPLPRPPVSVDPILPGTKPGGPFPGVTPLPGTVPPRIQDLMQFANKDRNRDGSLSQAEFGIKPLNPIGGLHDLKKQHEQLERFKKFDANGDGQISREEYTIGRHWERMTEKVGGWLEGIRPTKPFPVPSPFGEETQPTRPVMPRPSPERPWMNDLIQLAGKEG